MQTNFRFGTPSTVQPLTTTFGSDKSRGSSNKSRFPSYWAHYTALRKAVNSDPPDWKEVSSLLTSLETEWQHVPPHAILYEGRWEYKKPILQTYTHLNIGLAAASRNVTKTGRLLSDSERYYLGLLLEYWGGWSATYAQHMEDPCFKYIQWSFRNHVGHLHPILDDMWYPEEVRLLPHGIAPDSPARFLLADDKMFYFYLPLEDELYKAGPTLEGVFNGLLADKKLVRPFYETWETVEVPEYEGPDPFYHFPEYNMTENGIELVGPIKPFTPPPERVSSRL